MDGIKAVIIEQKTGVPVSAEVSELPDVEALLAIEENWDAHRRAMLRHLRRVRVPRHRWPQSLHWDWAKKGVRIALRQQPGNYRAFGIRAADEWQGAMLAVQNEYISRLDEDRGQGVIYVDFLETAPWNWNVPDIAQIRRYRAVGPILLRIAIEQSIAEGLGGRIGLHALEQAEGFYSGIGMTSLGLDSTKEDLTYFEFTVQAALQFIGR